MVDNSLHSVYNKISRRGFLKILAVSGLAGLTAKFSLDAFESEQVYHQSELLMGTVVNLTLVCKDCEHARGAASAVFESMAALESLLSRFQPHSQVSILNRFGELQGVNPHLTALFNKSAYISQISAGAFDITIQPLYSLYSKYAENGKLPPVTEIEKTRSLVDFRKLVFSDESAYFSQQGMAVSLDAIAKGYIIDQGVEVLRQNGFTNMLVESGGDLMAAGEKGLHTPWRLGVQSPRGGQREIITQFLANNQAVATSGDYWHPFSADLEHHHILDPRSGFSPSNTASVTVITQNAADADALATSLMVLGVGEGLALIEKLPGVEALIITKDMDLFTSSGFPLSS